MRRDISTSFDSLLEAAERAELLIFAGAGISMLEPSCLPDWKGFNRTLLEEIKASALTLPGLQDSAAAAIHRLDLEHLAVEAFSDAVVSSFAGESYFPILEVLDSDQTNAHHQAIAELARRGACRAVVTTNFDRLIERAIEEIRIPYDTFVTPDDFRRNPKTQCAIYKIHGSVTASTTLVDTVTQKLRGLSFPVRARLIDLFHRHHVLVVGFSGGDLVFGADYLALSTLKGGDRGITWIVEPGKTLNPQAEAIVRGARGAAPEITLTEVFTHLGVAPAARKVTANAAAAGQAEADRRAQVRIRQWLEELGNGPLGSVLFCIALADERGWRAEANALRAAVAADLQRRGRTLPLNAIVAFNNLAGGAEQAGDYRSMGHWAGRALAMCTEFERRRQIETEPVSPAGMRDMENQWITSYIQLGRSRAGSGDTTGAREAFARARRAAEALRDADSLSHLLMNELLLLRREDSSVEEQLELARRAWSLAAKKGSAQVITESAAMEAHILATIGEYDAALWAVERGERAIPWSGSLLTRLAPELMRAEVTARRGRHDEAAEEFECAIAKARADPVIEARLRLLAVATLAFHLPFLERAMAHVDWVLAAMADDRIPRDGTNALLATEARIKELPAAVTDIAASGVPTFLTLPDGVAEAERGLRRALLKAEHEGDIATVPRILLSLANSRYDAAKPRRMLDLAEAALHAAERANERHGRLSALHLVTVARDLSGDFKGAIAAGREVLDANPPTDDEIRIRASQSLGLVLAKVGRAGEAEPLLRAAVAYHQTTGAVAEHARSIIALADTLASGGDSEGARAVLDHGATVINRTGDRVAIAKRDAMLASLRPHWRGPRLIPPLLFADGEVVVSLERIEQLRHKSESAAEQCDIAAMALGSGHTRAAVDLVLDAQASFHQDSDTQGLARCFHLLADAAAIGGRWDNAADFTRHALTLEDEIEDAAGQISSYAALSLQFIEVGQVSFAGGAATQCLARAGPGYSSRFTVIARYVLAEAHKREGRSQHARREAELARKELPTVGDLPSGSTLRLWLEQRLAALPSRSALRVWLEK